MSTKDLGVGSRIRHPKFGEGVLVATDGSFYKIYFHEVEMAKNIARDYPNFELLEKKEVDHEPLSLLDIEKAVENALRKAPPSEPIPKVTMAQKWIGGTMTLSPYNSELSEKEVPISNFFKKIILIRERLRVLEQNINNHEKLDDQDKIHLQQYITRIYGSLTTFNVLFADKGDYFIGAGKED